MHNGSSVSSPFVVLSLSAHELDYTSFNEATTAKKWDFTLWNQIAITACSIQAKAALARLSFHITYYTFTFLYTSHSSFAKKSNTSFFRGWKEGTERLYDSFTHSINRWQNEDQRWKFMILIPMSQSTASCCF